jgi:hypothetical protein
VDCIISRSTQPIFTDGLLALPGADGFVVAWSDIGLKTQSLKKNDSSKGASNTPLFSVEKTGKTAKEYHNHRSLGARCSSGRTDRPVFGLSRAMRQAAAVSTAEGDLNSLATAMTGINR